MGFPTRQTHELVTAVLALRPFQVKGSGEFDTLLARALERAQELADLDIPRDYLVKSADGLPMGVVLVIPRGDRFLAVRNPRRGGHAEFPGGGVETDLLSDAVKEGLEEVGLVIQDPIPFFVWEGSDRYESTFVLAEVDEDALPVQGDAGPVEWVTEEELARNPHFGESNVEAMAVYYFNPMAACQVVQTLGYYDGLAMTEVLEGESGMYLTHANDSSEGNETPWDSFLVVRILPETLDRMGKGEVTYREVLEHPAGDEAYEVIVTYKDGQRSMTSRRVNPRRAKNLPDGDALFLRDEWHEPERRVRNVKTI